MKSFKIIGGEEFNCCAIYRWDKTVAIMSDLLRGEAWGEDEILLFMMG